MTSSGHRATRAAYLVTHCRRRDGEIVYATSHEDAAMQAFKADAARRRPRYAVQVGEQNNFVTVFALGAEQEFVPEFTQPVITSVREKP